jgi:hypothetical protein
MNAEKHILKAAVKALKNSPFPSGPDRQTADATLAALAKASGQTYEVPRKKQTIMERMKIMKTCIKFAAAAAIILTSVLLINHFDKLATPAAYALEQTLEACKNKQQVHFTFVQKGILKKAAWVEYDTEGNMARMRVDLSFENDSNGEMSQVNVWQGGHTQTWNVKDKELLLYDDEQYSAILLHFVNRYDPRQAVENIQEMEQKGKVKIGIEQPPDRSKPIVATINYEPNTFTLNGVYPPMREVMFIDQTTKLVTAVEVWGPGKYFGLKGDELALLGTYKYDGYDEPFEDGIFNLKDAIGEDVNVIDLMTLDVGLEFTEPNLTEEQMAVATVRAFFESLIAKDYNETVRLFCMPEGKKAEFLKRLEKMSSNVVEIISIGKPHPPTRGRYLIVPCTVVIEVNGHRIEKKLEDVRVQRATGHPNRRIVIINAEWDALEGN